MLRRIKIYFVMATNASGENRTDSSPLLLDPWDCTRVVGLAKASKRDCGLMVMGARDEGEF